MKNLAVIGLGYVGLPLAVAFGEKREVVGFDINAGRIAELKDGVDFTREVSREELAAANKLSFTRFSGRHCRLPGLHRDGADSN